MRGFSFTAGLIYNKGSGSAGNVTDTKDNIGAVEAIVLTNLQMMYLALGIYMPNIKMMR